MKFSTVFFLAAAVAVVPLRAQETAEPLPEKLDPIEASPVEEMDPLAQPLRLIPDAPDAEPAPDYGDPAALATEAERLRQKMSQPSETQISARKQKEQIDLRKARTRAEKDERVQEAWRQADKALTDPERRFALGLYYNRLYDRMLKLDGSLAEPIKLLRKTSLGELEQDEIRPSVWDPATGRVR